MKTPFFSVVIPTYNRTIMLKRAIDSVLNQTFENFELIIIDDNSTDNTKFIIESFDDNRIRFSINSRTKGACGARNTGIFLSKGQWIAFLDDDDEWMFDKLKYQHELILNASSSVGMICTDYNIYKGNGRKPLKIRNRPSGRISEQLLYGFTMGCLSSTVIKSDILYKIKGFDEAFPSNQDWDLWLRVADLCEVESVHLPLVKMYQEVRKDRIGQNYRSKLIGHMKLEEKYRESIKKSAKCSCRHNSLIFTYAVIEGEYKIICKSFPWFFIGIYVDSINFLKTVRNILIILFRKLVSP